MRYFIELSYDGTSYCGWQRQINGPSVQEELEKAMTTILQQPVEIVGSSRTDAGVHAEQQWAHFDVEQPLEDFRRLTHSLNLMLPQSIAVQQIMGVESSAHSRFNATHRCYEYRLIAKKNPFLTHKAYVFRTSLNVEAMNEAATLLLEYNDFECFSKTHTDVKTFLCDIEYAHWQSQNEMLIFRIKANRFLRGMVRGIVGTLLQIGQGRLSKADFEFIIRSKNRKNAAAQAPAQGLFLTEVGYTEAIKA